jgi:hypothetical protein
MYSRIPVIPEANTAEILMLWQLMEKVPSPEISALIIPSSKYSGSTILSRVVWTLLRPSCLYDDFQTPR